MNVPYKPDWINRLLLTLTTVTLVIVGFFFLTVALVVGTLIALVIGVRLWWTLRKLKHAPGATDTASDVGGGTLDGEYQVIEHESAVTPLPPSAPPPNNTPPAP